MTFLGYIVQAQALLFAKKLLEAINGDTKVRCCKRVGVGLRKLQDRRMVTVQTYY